MSKRQACFTSNQSNFRGIALLPELFLHAVWIHQSTHLVQGSLCHTPCPDEDISLGFDTVQTSTSPTTVLDL